MIGAALGAILLFGVLAFGAVEPRAARTLDAAWFVLLAAICTRAAPRMGLATAAFGAVAVWGLVQWTAGMTADPAATPVAALHMAALAAASISAQALRARHARSLFLKGALVAAALITVAALVQAATTRNIYWIVAVRAGSPFGPFVNRDHFAILMELLIPIALWLAVRRNGSPWAGFSLAALFLAATLATGSRAGAAIAIAEVAVLGPLAWRMTRGAWPVARRAVLAGVAIAAAAAATGGWRHLATRIAGDDDPYRIRREMALSSLALIAERPWTGHGLGAFETVYPSKALFEANARIDHAHNDWLELAVETGLPMTALFIGLIATALWRGRRAVWAWGASAALLHALVDFPMAIPGLASLIVVLAAGGELSAVSDQPSVRVSLNSKSHSIS